MFLNTKDVIIASACVLMALVFVGIIASRVGKKELRLRLSALASRLGDDPGVSERESLDRVLSRLEIATDHAAQAVGDASADAIRLRRTIDRLPQGVLVADEQGDIIFRNVSAVELLGSSHSDAIATQAVEELLYGGLEKGGSSERVLDLFGPPRRALSLKCISVDDGQRALGVVVVVDDITELRRLEEIRRDFVANVSHELKTPMGALGLLAETLNQETDVEIAQRLANRIQQEAFRASRIIDDLLDLSRIEASESPSKERVSVALIAAESLERVRQLAEKNEIKIEVIEPVSDVYVIGDRHQLVSTINNLLENAIKYSDPGKKVTLRYFKQDNNVKISVEDEGLGIPNKDLDRIFERFYRVDHGRSRATGGTGLGLSIVRHVMANHQGSVDVESQEGVGSTFIVTLPVASEVGQVIVSNEY